ncbi:helix-turn-helix domain-containing protein [Dyadobacter sp. CY326]|uniref:helix-turn-helix domain-containing protein n=1 Tax=Dyadobacter sp. CY326 TaxID=2907300 RepID=UPI001F38DF89|nr:helix-turn-helix transcriptional regulator [Dyadobacter sp. CY326]MCE7068404.1 helix-turn-helix transcriptional regulator [Dyadobacter sp. CY326]
MFAPKNALQTFRISNITFINEQSKEVEKDALLIQLGLRIRELRKMKNITQAELAHNIGKDQQSIQRLEAGKINPSFFYLHEIAIGLSVPLREITEVF